jgi:transcriptional regulator NrdR family protein
MKRFTIEDAKEFIRVMKLDMRKEKFGKKEILNGLNVEIEHGTVNKETNVTNDDLIMTGKIALAHLREFSNYYELLEKMEKEGNKNKIGRKRMKVYKLKI